VFDLCPDDTRKVHAGQRTRKKAVKV